ncbi:SMI1/KNR4 family protein [Planococcus sp. X10-3]|uniref:SMI1/KNR4 family protein n=1 Tax=Planococcus sp. X10-3 TaxID=3061240 RepID=UPI003BB1B832
MKWILSKPLKNMDLVKDFENKHQIVFPGKYLEVVKEYNNGRPRPNVFDSEENKERVAKSLLSFDPDHQDNVWETYKVLYKQLPSDVFPFIIDQFGNYVCFFYDPLLEEPSIVFWNLEEQQTEKVASSFEDFLNQLYSID